MAAPVVLAIIEALKVAIGALTSKIDAAIAFADKSQEASLALGKTFEQTRKTLGPQLEGLRGSISQRFEAGIKTLEAGMTGNTLGVSRLINQQMLTNTAFRNTATSFAKLEIALGLTRSETNRLAEVTIAAGNKYQISTDKLVETINALKDTMPIQKMAGLGESFQEAILMLQGEVGPQAQEDLISVLKTILDPALENLPTLAILGIQNVREQLAATNDQREQYKILKSAVLSAENNLRILTTGADKFYGTTSIPLNLMGNKILSFSTVFEALGKRVDAFSEVVADYYKTLQIMKREFWIPIELALSELHTPLTELYEVVAAVSRTVGIEFARLIKELIPTKDSLKDVKLAIVNLGKSVLEFLVPAFKFFFTIYTTLYGGLLKFAVWLTTEFLIPGGVLDQFVSALYSLTSTILNIASKIPGSMVSEDLAKSFEKEAFLKQVALAANTGGNLEGVGFLDNLKEQSFGRLVYGGVPNLIITALNSTDFAKKAKELGVEKEFTKLQDSVKNGTIAAQNKATEELRASLGKLGSEAENEMRRLENAIKEGTSLDAFLSKEMLKYLEEISENTTPSEPGSYFMDQTAELLGTAMDRILGIRGDRTPQEMLEELQKTNSILGAQQLLSRGTPSVLSRTP